MSASGSTEESISTVRSAIEAFNTHDVSRRFELMSDNFTSYSPIHPKGLRGRVANSQDVQRDLTAFPNLQLRIERLVGNGEWVCVQGVLTGTNTGRLISAGGRPVRPTKNPIEIRQSIVYRVEGGKVTEVYEYYDQLRVELQLGVAARSNRRLIIYIVVGLILMSVGWIGSIQDVLHPANRFLAAAFPVGIWLIALSAYFLRKTVLPTARPKDSVSGGASGGEETANLSSFVLSLEYRRSRF